MKSSLFDLAGKVALVTGGSKGLGKAMARGFAEAGADIVISSRHEDELKSALNEILDGTDGRGAWLVADMTDRMRESSRFQTSRAASRTSSKLRAPGRGAERRHTGSLGDVTRLSRWPKDIPRGGGPRTDAHRATGAASPLWDSYAM